MAYRIMRYISLVVQYNEDNKLKVVNVLIFFFFQSDSSSSQ